MTTLTMIDEVASGLSKPAGTLVVPESWLTAREIIRRRVTREVDAHNAAVAGGAGAAFVGLVQPTGPESRLNSQVKARQAGARRIVDAEKQYEAAVRAFERGAFLLFVGERQVEELDEVVEFTEDAEVSFLKLVALVGG